MPPIVYSSSDSEDYLTPTPVPNQHNTYFQGFDYAAEDEAEAEAVHSYDGNDEFDIPYDHDHRPRSTLDFDQLIPESKKPLTIVNPDDSQVPSPQRGRSIHRVSQDNQHHIYIEDSPPREEKYQKRSQHKKNNTPEHLARPVTMSRHTGGSSSASSVFDEPTFDNPDDAFTDPTQVTSRGASADDAAGSYDLKPPPPSNLLENIEYLAGRIFSSDHLKLILKDPGHSARFNNFLAKYRPDSRRALQHYTNVQKALSAVDYANSLAESVGGPGTTAAQVDEEFEVMTKKSVDELVDAALPGYVTHRLVQIVTEVLVKEITGQNTPIMRELVAGLAEVYCLTDPALPDNPIVYASEEFYRCTQYGKNYTIGRNCRFLQGPKSSHSSVQRLVDALGEGQEICETILNYRRDGSPFMNLLMIAPLYDNKGSVRYFIGAQIDVNGLIEGGRGMDSFEQLLKEDRASDRYGGKPMGKTPEQALGELSGLFDDDDLESITSRGTAGKKTRQESSAGSGASTPVRRRQPNNRRFVGMDDPTDRGLWPAPSLGPSGRLPGVFQNYLLIRPYPSLRITFTSPALRIPGLLQSKFLDRIGGTARIRDQILDALSSGVGVTAKITWLPNAPSTNTGDKDGSNQGGSYRENDTEGRQRWIHCTPLLGSDERVGVWMVVMVENETVTGSLHANGQSQSQSQRERGASAAATETTDRTASTARTNSNVGGGKYYQEYLRNEGRSLGESGARGDSVARDRNQNGSQYEGSQRGMDGTSEPRDGIQRAREEKMLQQQQQQQQGGIQTRQSSATYQRQQPVGYRQGSQQGQPRMRRGSDQAQDLPVRGTGFGSPKQFPGELRPITTAYSSNPSASTGQAEDKQAKARRLAERATAGEESFRDF